MTWGLVALKVISCIYLVFYIVQRLVIAVGNNRFALFFEFCQIINNKTSKEGLAIRDSGFIDDDLGTFGFDALHDALDGALAEIVRVALHSEAVNTNHTLLFTIRIPLTAGFVIASLAKDFVGNEVLTGAIALDNGGHHVPGDVGIVGQQLLGVLREAGSCQCLKSRR